jgi:hypothetical protein
MSLFSYISFPREVDTSILSSKFDPQKAYRVGDIKGREKEFGISIDMSRLPDDLMTYTGPWSDFNGISISENLEGSTFKGCFKNEYIYKFGGELSYTGDPSLWDDTSEFVVDMMKNTLENIEISRKQLHDLLVHNLSQGEFVEIYSEYVSHTDFDLGPHENEEIFFVDEILTSEKLATIDKLRIEIRL